MENLCPAFVPCKAPGVKVTSPLKAPTKTLASKLRQTHNAICKLHPRVDVNTKKHTTTIPSQTKTPASHSTNTGVPAASQLTETQRNVKCRTTRLFWTLQTNIQHYSTTRGLQTRESHAGGVDCQARKTRQGEEELRECRICGHGSGKASAAAAAAAKCEYPGIRCFGLAIPVAHSCLASMHDSCAKL